MAVKFVFPTDPEELLLLRLDCEEALVSLKDFLHRDPSPGECELLLRQVLASKGLKTIVCP